MQLSQICDMESPSMKESRSRNKELARIEFKNKKINMSELITMVAEQSKMIATLQKQIQDLTVLIMKDKVNDTWLVEETAASMLGYNPETFRRKVKEAHKKNKEPWNIITYRNTNGRNWYYNRKSLIEFQRKTSIDQ